jgi:hypothetical protein
MKTTSTLGALAGITALIAGCSSMHSMADRKNCDDGDCTVTVVVTPRDGTPACTIGDPGDFFVGKGKKPELVWTIQNSGAGQFKFPGNGVALKSGKWSDGGIFQDKGTMHNGTEYRVKDNNNKKKVNPSDPPFRFPYKITVVKQDESPGCTLDPTILNDGCGDMCP